VDKVTGAVLSTHEPSTLPDAFKKPYREIQKLVENVRRRTPRVQLYFSSFDKIGYL
jgi:hypothetical protein